MTKEKADSAQTDITNPDEMIQKADQELESISTTINELATRQQRLIGYISKLPVRQLTQIK